MDHFDDRVKALQKRSLQVLPLSYRRDTPQKLLPVEALCEFDTDEVFVIMFLAKAFLVCCMALVVHLKFEKSIKQSHLI